MGVAGVMGVTGVNGVNGVAARQALQRRSGPQLLEHGLQADDLPHAELADSN